MRAPRGLRAPLVALAVTALAAPVSAITPPRPAGPGRVWYVDNTAEPAGDGSLVAPFDRLARAERAADDGDTIYVFRGDGSSRGLDTGIRLRPYQRLLGSGVALAIDGEETIAAGEPPLLTAGGAGLVVELGEEARVEGLTLRGTGEAVIAGRAVRGVRLRHLHVDGGGAAAVGVALDGTPDLTVDEVRVTAARRAGIRLDRPSEVSLRNCRVEGSGSEPGDAAVLVRQATATVRVERCELTAAAGAALAVEVSTGASRLEVEGVLLAGEGGGAAAVTGLSAVARGEGVLELVAHGNDLPAGETAVLLSASGAARLSVDLRGNALGGAESSRGVVFLLADDAAGSLSLQRNRIAGQRGEAVYAVAAVRARLSLSASDNDLGSGSAGTPPLPALLAETRDDSRGCIELGANRFSEQRAGAARVTLRQRGDSLLGLLGSARTAAVPAELAAGALADGVQVEAERPLASGDELPCPHAPEPPAAPGAAVTASS